MAFLRNPVVYVPDLNNGRPIVDGKVYALVSGTVPPMHDSAIDPLTLLTVTYENEAGNIVEAPQPLYTSKGGCLYGNYPDSARQYMITPQEYVYAVYNRIGQLEYSGETFADDYVESAALAATDSTVLIAGVEASTVGYTIKAQQSVRAFDPTGILNSNVDHTAVLQAAIDASSSLGIEILLHPQTYNYSTLVLKTGMALKGSGTDKCFFVCSSVAGSGDPILWSIKKADDGNRARNIRIENIYIGKATSGVATAQDANPSLGGLCLAACENSLLRNLSFGAFGQGGIVLARAEAGAEGLGFNSTTQDGNYNIGQGLYFASCGKYNSAKAALWFKYKANSNKFYGVFGKGLAGAYAVGYSHANDNCIFGGTAESCLGIASFSPTSGGAVYGNKIDGMRLEVSTGDAYYFDGGDSCAANDISGGYYTGVGLLLVNKIAAPNNFVRIPGYYDAASTSSANEFPPASSFSTRYQVGMQRLDSLRAGGTKPLYRVSDVYNDNAKPVEVIDWSSCLAPVAGTVLATWGVRCSDSSSGGAGVNARLSVKTVDAVGNTEWLFQCGRESDTITDAVRISKTEVEILGTAKAFVMKSPDGTRYKLTPPNGGGAATWVLA